MTKPTQNQNPEQITRDRIDQQLIAAGWAVQDKRSIDFNTGQGIAIREYKTDVGPADYALFVDKKAVGIIEAKPATAGHQITTVEEQSAGYAGATLKWVNNTVSSLAGRLARLNKQLDDRELARISQAADGKALTEIVSSLLNAIDSDRIEETDRKLNGDCEPAETQREQARDRLVVQAASVFTGPLIELIDGIRRDKEQTIDHDNLDTVLRAEWHGDTTENAKALKQDFEHYLYEHRDEIEALTIFYSQPARRSELTFAMIKSVLEKLKQDRPKLAPLRVWQAYAHLDDYQGNNPDGELTALVALIRRVCGIDPKLAPYADTVRRNFQNWIMKRQSGASEKFSEEQMAWLRMIRDHVSNSFHIERDDLEMSPFDAQGGIGWMYQLFGERMDAVIEELNRELAV